MAIDLPTLPFASSVQPKFLPAGGDLKSTLGGPTQHIVRLGSRFSVDVQLPKMGADVARAWIARTVRAKAEGLTLRLALPQPGDAPTGLTGSGSAGSNAVTASASGAAEGMLFSFTAGGVNYLHMVAPGSSGTALIVTPPLRAALSGAMEFAAPVIEGSVDAPSVPWTIERARILGLAFTLTEDR